MFMALYAHPHLSKPKAPRADGSRNPYRHPSARLGSDSGMSLIELLVVAAIISMMAGLLALGLKGMKSPAIQGAASQVTSGLSLARQLAITKNTKAALLIAMDNNNGRIPLRHWAVGYSNRTGNWTVAKKWEPLPEGTFFLESVTNTIDNPPMPKALGEAFFASTNDFKGGTPGLITIESTGAYRCITFSSDGAASITGNATAIAIRIASGMAETNGEVTLTSTNQYYFVETDSIVGRIRMRAPESYR